MTVELVLCIAAFMLALPMSRSIAVHYAAFALVNLALLGVQYADSSLLALVFAGLAAADVLLIISGGRRILLVPAIASVALSIESMLNMDFLLNQISYLSVAVNAVIGATLAREYVRWMDGKYGRS